MFDLDYLTQRLTFTRHPDTRDPTLIKGYAPTFTGDVHEVAVETSEPLAAELDAFLAVARGGVAPMVGVEDGLWAVAIAEPCSRPRPSTRRSSSPGSPPAWSPPDGCQAPSTDARPRTRIVEAQPGLLGARRLRARTRGRVHARAGAVRPAVDGRAGHGRHGRGRRRRQDGPAARRAVRLPRLACHRGRHRPARGRLDQRRPQPRRRAGHRRDVAAPRPADGCARREARPRPRRRTSSSSSSRSCSTRTDGRTTARWMRRSPRCAAGSMRARP